jgi:hypothetical protein
MSWNFLSASCTFWLTMSSNISMKFLVITCRISSLCLFLWVLLSSLASFFLVCWSKELSVHFLHFPLNPVLNYFGGRMVFIPFSSSYHSTLYCATMFLIGSLMVSVTFFLSLGLILFCGCTEFLVSVCAIYVLV